MIGTEAQSTSLLHRTIEKAAKIPNPIEPFANEFANFIIGNGSEETLNSETLTTYCKWKAKMDANTLKWVSLLNFKPVSYQSKTYTYPMTSPTNPNRRSIIIHKRLPIHANRINNNFCSNTILLGPTCR